jgi:hypothetical protein
LSVDPDVAQTGQPYAYTGDDPVNGADPLGLWGWNPISDAEQAVGDVNRDADDVGHFLKDPNRWRAEADYLASVGNGIVSTVTLGHVHIAAPYCGYGLASDLGDVIGTALTIVVGGDLGGAVDVLRGAETVEEAEAAVQTSSLGERVKALQGAVDPIAQTRRTAAILSTQEGVDILASGGRDLDSVQRALANEGEILARLPGAHAEITALDAASKAGLTPAEMVVSRAICSACQAAIEGSGGTINPDQLGATWP